MQLPKPQEIYRHFKGNQYRIITLAQHTETGEGMVVYQSLTDEEKVYVRPLDMFMSPVDRIKYPDATQDMRFEKVDDVKMADLEVAKQKVAERDAADQKVQEPEAPAQEVAVEDAEYQLDPAVEDFMDARTYEDRLNILTSVQHRVTEDMLRTMAMSCDIELPEGDVLKKYDSFKKALQTLERYECNRLR